MAEEIMNGNIGEEVATPTKRRGRPPKSETAVPAAKPKASKSKADDKPAGNWNSIQPDNIPMLYMTVELEYLEKALGTSPSNKELLSDYIASRAPDAASTEEEIAQLGEDVVFEKGTTIYPKGTFVYNAETDRYWDILDRDTPKTAEGDPEVEGERFENVPFLYNYQIRGYFKDSCSLLARADKDSDMPATESSKLKAYKKIIDGGIFVFPRRIAIDVPDTYMDDDGVTLCNSHDEAGNLFILQRPLRISGPTGERTAIAASEMIPPGSRLKFTIGMTNPKYRDLVIEWLNYGMIHGLTGWKNSGTGIFRWREIKPDYTPIEEK